MLNPNDSLKYLRGQAEGALRQLLGHVPAIELLSIGQEVRMQGQEVDIVAHVDVHGRRHALVCEVKPSGQPRHARLALIRLRDFVANRAQDIVPVFIAPYLSPGARALCGVQQVGYLDLEGNARLVFGSVFIERQVASKPVVERRELRSLYKPKSAQVLRAMLRDPQRAWRVTELAESADVSLGHVSNVRAGLLDREWARVSGDGLYLCEPDALLDAWRDAYEPPTGQRMGFYTALHGSMFEDAVRRILSLERDAGHVALASFSAAHWLASYGRIGTHYFYADDVGLEQLRAGLQLSSVSKGENVMVTLLKDPGVLRDAVEPAPGVICTSPVQTYLDLASAGERGREAAEHLRQERLTWRK